MPWKTIEEKINFTSKQTESKTEKELSRQAPKSNDLQDYSLKMKYVTFKQNVACSLGVT